MTSLPLFPSADQPISATLIREIIRSIRAITPIQGKNVSLSYTPNGVVINAAGTSSTVVPSPSPNPPSRFSIAEVIKEYSEPEDEDESPTLIKLSLKLANLYYRVGGKSYSISVTTAGNQDIVTVYDIDDTAAPEKPIVALKVNLSGDAPSASLVAYKDLAALNAAEQNLNYYIQPLYFVEAQSGAISCDLRIGPPDINAGEFANEEDA